MQKYVIIFACGKRTTRKLCLIYLIIKLKTITKPDFLFCLFLCCDGSLHGSSTIRSFNIKSWLNLIYYLLFVFHKIYFFILFPALQINKIVLVDINNKNTHSFVFFKCSNSSIDQMLKQLVYIRRAPIRTSIRRSYGANKTPVLL